MIRRVDPKEQHTQPNMRAEITGQLLEMRFRMLSEEDNVASSHFSGPEDEPSNLEENAGEHD
jgi:hypothetical protein